MTDAYLRSLHDASDTIEQSVAPPAVPNNAALMAIVAELEQRLANTPGVDQALRVQILSSMIRDLRGHLIRSHGCDHRVLDQAESLLGYTK